MAKAKQPKPAPAADDVVRESAGSYKSGDGRFEIRQSEATWFLVDLEQTNEFGQELIHGPFGSLKQARAQMPGARDVKPLLRSVPRRASAKTKATTKPKPDPPKSWLDRLTEKEAAAARTLIRALEREGLPDAEDIVRLHRDDRAPTIATRLVEHRVAALIDEQPEADRERLRGIVQELLRTLTTDGAAMPKPLPRWGLAELADEEQARPRLIRPRI